MKTILLMDAIIAAVGVYTAIQAIIMKAGGKISTLVVPPEEIKGCKDPKGYINTVFPLMLILAVIVFATGLIGVLCDLEVITVGRVWTIVELLLFLSALCVFTWGMRRAKEKFFGKM